MLWLMLALLVLFIAVMLTAWLLGRLLGPKANWGKPLTDPKRREDANALPDAWSESARRLRLERDDEDQTSSPQ